MVSKKLATPYLPCIQSLSKGNYMRESSIVRFIRETQYVDVEQVYCPMCEVLHENNTFCQIPGWEN